jgi:hypothetical protein
MRWDIVEDPIEVPKPVKNIQFYRGFWPILTILITDILLWGIIALAFVLMPLYIVLRLLMVRG